MKIQLEVDLARNSDGSYDHDTMLDSARSALIKLESEKELEQGAIRDAVNACFDQYPGAHINFPALISMTCQRLNAQPANWAVLAARTAEFIRENSQGDVVNKETGEVQFPNSPFIVAKGKNGGCYRRSDVIKPTVATK